MGTGKLYEVYTILYTLMPTYVRLHYFFLSSKQNFQCKVMHIAIKLTYAVVEAPATFIAMELWHTMDYLMP
jgi:hypothetical protein